MAVVLVPVRHPHHGDAEGQDLAEHGVDRGGAGGEGDHPSGPGLGQAQAELEGGGVGRGEAHAERVPPDGPGEPVDLRAQVGDPQAHGHEGPGGGRHPWWKTTPCPPSG